MIKRSVLVLLAVGIVYGAIVGAHYFDEKKRYSEAFEKLAPGADVSTVLKSFGKPSGSGKCELKSSWDESPLTRPCVKQLCYRSRVSPEQWIIGFDETDKVIAKNYFSSR